jgi:hypothetical protein
MSLSRMAKTTLESAPQVMAALPVEDLSKIV